MDVTEQSFKQRNIIVFINCNLFSTRFASTSQNSPIHLWDAYSGCLRATYQPINQYVIQFAFLVVID